MPKQQQNNNNITIKGAREHNLQNINVDLPINALTVITGVSGSGKSSLAFDTLYAEGQRRYVESLSAYARQFLGLMNKPDVDSIKGLSPAISIEQKSVSKNPRSTVGTITEVYDYLRLLFAKIGHVHCPQCNKPIQSHGPEELVDMILATAAPKSKLQIMAPVIRGKKGTYEKLFQNLDKQGFARVRLDGEVMDIEDVLEQIKKKPLNKNVKHFIEVIIDRIIIPGYPVGARRAVPNDSGKKEVQHRLQDSIETAFYLSENLVLLDVNGTEQIYSKNFTCIECNISFEELQPRMFSFNSPFGACEACHGLGKQQSFARELVVPDESLSINQGAVKPWQTQVHGWRGKLLAQVAKHYKFSMDKPFKNLAKKHQDIVLYGSPDRIKFKLSMKNGESNFNYTDKFEGAIPQLERLYRQTESEWRKRQMEAYMIEQACPDCDGQRLKPESLAVLIGGINIHTLTLLSVEQVLATIKTLKLTKTEQKIANLIIKEISTRLQFLIDVGLNYLTLAREAGTLSGGEAQRIRLATQIGSELRGVLYILDEPSIGLHQKDNDKLITTLQKLRDLGNTLVVVEHDEQTMRQADYLIDIGPGAGKHGGKIVSQGTAKQVANDKQSLTGQYLAGTKSIAMPTTRRKSIGWLELLKAEQNNLKKLDIKFPLGVFTVITGVSGSGKSTLINRTLYPALHNKLNKSHKIAGKHDGFKGFEQVNKIINIDQSPIGRTPRSNPATYIKVFDDIRTLFSQTPEAKIRGYKPGRFSFNVAHGRCHNCDGDGMIKIEMHFLPDIYVECEKCKGKRYNRETLEVDYKGKSIADVLAMTVEEALIFFENIPSIKRKLQTLYDVGLGYIQLGQPATTLSGGEAQRIKLTAELAKRDTGQTVYILDEPTTGLHFVDIANLLEVLNRLVEKGNTVLVIEHNLDVIKNADYIIDLGPDGGDAGGQIVAQGTPEQVAKVKKSYTGQYLKPMIYS